MYPKTDRAITPVLGIALLLGITAIGAISLLALAGDATATAEHDAEVEHAETAFTELSQTMATTSAAGDVGGSVDLAVGDAGAVVTHDRAWIQVAHEGPDGEAVGDPIQLGTVEYESSGGTTVAAEGGAVFRSVGDGSSVVSTPPIHYDHTTQTLNLPIVDVDPSVERLPGGDVSLVHDQANVSSHSRIVEDATVTVTVHSEYADGWGRILASHLGSAAIEEVDEETVTARIGHLELAEAFDAGITHADGYDVHRNANVTGDVRQGTMPALDGVIESIHADTMADNDTVDLGTIDTHTAVTNGTYLADGIEETGHLAADLTDGDVTLVVDGDVHADEDTITVTEWRADHELSVYLTGDLDMRHGGDIYAGDRDTDDEARLIQVYGTSETQVDVGPGGDARFEGVLYVAGTGGDWESRSGCDAQVCIQSNPNLFGAIVAESVDIQAAAVDLHYDEALAATDIDLYPEEYDLPPQLTYLNVVHHQVDVTPTR